MFKKLSLMERGSPLPSPSDIENILTSEAGEDIGKAVW
jgi:hypothetical protein